MGLAGYATKTRARCQHGLGLEPQSWLTTDVLASYLRLATGTVSPLEFT